MRATLRRLAMWIAIHIPLGPLNPHLLAYGLGTKRYFPTDEDPRRQSGAGKAHEPQRQGAGVDSEGDEVSRRG